MGNKNGHIRSINRIERVLKESDEPLSSGEVYDRLLIQKKPNSDRTYTNTITRNQLTNLLSKNIQFKRSGTERSASSLRDIALWEFLEGENEKTESDN